MRKIIKSCVHHAIGGYLNNEATCKTPHLAFTSHLHYHATFKWNDIIVCPHEACLYNNGRCYEYVKPCTDADFIPYNGFVLLLSSFNDLKKSIDFNIYDFKFY